uniref:Uncharacterized protein n=1 Tax=Octopus bimaculoides TaxID=37653 RepID=A0A0L8FYN3_OCTBM
MLCDERVDEFCWKNERSKESNKQTFPQLAFELSYLLRVENLQGVLIFLDLV